MSWLLAVAYVSAAWMLLSGVVVRTEPQVASMLEPVERPRVQRPSPLAFLGRKAKFPLVRETVVHRLEAAGLPLTGQDRVVGAKAALGGFGVFAGIAIWQSGPAPAVLAAVILGACGFRLPDFLLARRASQLRALASADVPGLLDAVAVSVTAGLTPRLALERAPEAVSGPLAVELARARREVALGGSWRRALREVADRAGIRELRRLASTLERSERIGAPVADRLRALAHEVRSERRARAEERARRAPVTMLFPLVFLILPAFVLAAVVPAVLVATRGVQ